MPPPIPPHSLPRAPPLFLAEGDKVKVSVIFRGRENAHPELGRVVLDKVIADLKNVAILERPPIMEGRMITMTMSRAPGWEPPAKMTPQTRDRKDGKSCSISLIPPIACVAIAVVVGWIF
jgi:hypothetical protein